MLRCRHLLNDHGMTGLCFRGLCVANVAVKSKDNAHTANQQKASLQMPTDKTVTQLEPLDVLREMFQLVTDDILVRNIERDSLTGEYLLNASRLVMVLKRAETLLTKPTTSVPTESDLTNDAELAELLNMLMATNVHGAILQLRDHLDGDKRLLDNYQRLYKFRRGQS